MYIYFYSSLPRSPFIPAKQAHRIGTRFCPRNEVEGDA